MSDKLQSKFSKYSLHGTGKHFCVRVSLINTICTLYSSHTHSLQLGRVLSESCYIWSNLVVVEETTTTFSKLDSKSNTQRDDFLKVVFSLQLFLGFSRL